MQGTLPMDHRVRLRSGSHRVVLGLLLVTCGMLPAFSSVEVAAADASQPPNLVVILADDLGYGDLGCYGSATIPTPHLDRLANEGLRLTNFYVGQAVCTASRAALLTGCYPNRIGMAGALNHLSTTGIHPEERLLAELLKPRGYATATFGKWHLGLQPPFWPTNRGFDEFFGIPYSNDNGPLHPVFRDLPPLPLYDGSEVVERDPDQSHFTRRFTDRAVRFIERHKDRPFFLYLPHVMPHVPIFASTEWRGKTGRGPYADVVAELDAAVGEIIAAIDRNGLAERTLVIFTSDNGPFLSYGNHAGSAGPLREGKLTTFEGGMRVPCIARWPGSVPAGRVSDEMASTLDLFATILQLTGAEMPARPIDGIDLRPLLAGSAGAKGREEFLYYSGDELHAVRSGNWKLHLPHEFITVAGEPGRDGRPSANAAAAPRSLGESGVRGIASRHGYVVRSLPLSLYDLEHDPAESHNVAAEHPEIVARLEAIAARSRDDLGDALTGVKGRGKRSVGEVRRQAEPPAENAATSARRTTQPNIVVILADDLGYGDLGCYGQAGIRTPRLDRMAAEGMRFTNFYAQTVCGPSRAALMTGCYPSRVATKQNRVEIHPRLHDREVTVAELLGAAGYATGCFGKWDLAGHHQRGYDIDLLPTRQGFEVFFGTPTSNDHGMRLLRQEEVVEEDADMGTLTQRYTDEAIAFIRAHRDRPFFVYLPHSMPHVPLAASDRFRGTSTRGLYGDVIEELDWNTGRLLDALAEEGLDESTLVVFTSDNGPWLLDRLDRHPLYGKHRDASGWHRGSAAPLRGMKTSVWEGGVRVPCIMRAPGRMPAGAVCDEVASTMDILPTLARLAGVKAPDDRVIDGHDLGDLLAGKPGAASPYEALFYYQDRRLCAVRAGNWKLHLPRPAHESWAIFSLPEDGGALDRPLLFDLDTDVGERRDVAVGHPDVVARLTALADKARLDIGDADRRGSGARSFDIAP
jgi:arylsulfatase A-like enzyme